MTPFQSSADAPDGPFGPHTEATEAINSEPDMTAQHPDQLDRILVEMTEKSPDTLYMGIYTTREANAAIKSILSRLRASEAECEQLRLAICGGEDAPGYARSLPLQRVLDIAEENQSSWLEETELRMDAEALATSQAEIIKGLSDALERLDRNFALLLAGKPVRDVAETQAEVVRALASTRTPAGSDGARPDTGAVGGEGV